MIEMSLSSGVVSVNSGPLIVRTYNDDSRYNTYLLGPYDEPVEENRVLVTGPNGELTPSDSISVSSATFANVYTDTITITSTYAVQDFQINALTPGRAVVSNGLNYLSSSHASSAELNYLVGTTNFIQPQINARAYLSGGNAFNGAGFNTFTSSVGIGTTVPRARLHVVSSTNITNGLLVVSNAMPADAASKTLLTGLSYATLMPTMYGTSLYVYGTSGTVPFRSILGASTYFTGQHANQPVEGEMSLKDDVAKYVGLIVSSADKGYYSINPVTGEVTTGRDAITITEALPYIQLTTKDKDKAVWGVLTNVKNDSYNTDGTISCDDTTEWGDRLNTMVRVNGLGEGAVWVTDVAGPIENGDYICSSVVPGYGRRQDDDVLHNYTVAKATMSCAFDLQSDAYQCITVTHEGVTYRAAFVGCSYHCS